MVAPIAAFSPPQTGMHAFANQDLPCHGLWPARWFMEQLDSTIVNTPRCPAMAAQPCMWRPAEPEGGRDQFTS